MHISLSQSMLAMLDNALTPSTLLFHQELFIFIKDNTYKYTHFFSLKDFGYYNATLKKKKESWMNYILKNDNTVREKKCFRNLGF